VPHLEPLGIYVASKVSMRRSIAAIVIALSLLCLGVCADQIRLEPVP